MTLTRQQKGYIALGGAMLVLAYNLLMPDSSTPSATPRTRVTEPEAAPEETARSAREQAASRGRDEFLPKLRDKRATKQLDPTTVDPTLHTDLLAKLDRVPPAGSGRDLFSFGKAPVILKDPEPRVQVAAPVIGPRVIQRPVDAGPPKPAPPPPINLKYYGIVTTLANGKKTAFFMDGDEILLETEGVTFKGRYKLVRIGVNSAVVEDIEHKHEQTLPLALDSQG
jgi:hypothetical protein